MPLSNPSASPNGLPRVLGVIPGTAIVVGSVLGTGVFMKSATMAQGLGSAAYVLAAWIAAGLLSLAGAFVYAELGARFPHAGGEYVYLREGFGDLWAFLYGWTRFWIIAPASIAAYGVGSAAFLSEVWIAPDPLLKHAISLGLIIVFTLLNCVTVRFSGASQTFLTVIKAGILIALCLGAALTDVPVRSSWSLGAAPWPGTAAFGGALVAALWAYDGWNNLPMMAGEMRRPERTVPLALLLGTLIVIALYCAVNASYFVTLPFSEVTSSNSTAFPAAPAVAAKSATSYLGPLAIKLLSIAFVLSAVGALNGQILSGARVPYAMAKDGLFFEAMGRLSPKTQVPVTSTIVQSLVAIPMALTGSFDQLTDSVVFAAWIFYGASAGALFLFRRNSTSPAPYRCPGYPWLPGIFLALSGWLVVNTLVTNFWLSLGGLSLIALGIPVYFYFRRSSRARLAAAAR